MFQYEGTNTKVDFISDYFQKERLSIGLFQEHQST